MLSYGSFLFIGILLVLFVCLYYEISRRRRIHKRLKSLEAELAGSSQKLAAALQIIHQLQARLLQQEQLAGIGQLAAGIVHEINTPLAYVSNNMEILEKYFITLGTLSARYRAWRMTLGGTAEEMVREMEGLEKNLDLEYILRDIPDLLEDTNAGLQQINNIVREMRLFSRVDCQRSFERYDINRGLESILRVVHAQMASHAAVEKDLQPVPAIQAVGGEINQVLLNLVINALQAIRGKGPEPGKIRVSTWQDGAFVYCTVEDNGIGIPEENLNSIFNPFFTTKPVGQGTGLGLSISYEIIVKRHHGEIMVESIPGEVTKFILRLPVTQNQH
ncbi:multi-sensor signal transduction histidine kinase [Acetonema longum DSM 6540]|uniref:histidine kinase n=2 Tax=Acetonema TaxID=2373 RepID=F7NHT8_9FIRM|nr:multi-sensor signal transduction histidine kinase [Acetonema longum DSM 6540]